MFLLSIRNNHDEQVSSFLPSEACYKFAIDRIRSMPLNYKPNI